jgi:putative ABC transport system ATP-binding protein
VLITHESEVGDRTKRLIRLVDGRIVEDVRHSAVDHLPVGASMGRHTA